MKLKRFMALMMSAVLLVSSSAMDASAAVVPAAGSVLSPVEDEMKQDDAQTAESSAEDTEPASSQEYEDENIVSVPEKENEIPRTAQEAGIELTDGSERAAEDAAQKSEIKTVNEAAKGETEVCGTASVTESDTKITAELKNGEATDGLVSEETVDPKDKVRVIIVMDGESIIESNSKAEPNFFYSAKSWLMEKKQKSVASHIEDEVLEGEELDIRYHYTWITNGVAAEVEYGKIEEIEKVKGVKDVILEPVYTIDPQTVADGSMIGRQESWNAGYTGVGTKIAVIDTGLDYDHPSFADAPETSETSATQESIGGTLSKLHAASLWKNSLGNTGRADLTTEDVWYSTKIPYGFNYVDESLVIDHDNDTQGDHGTHVAGIAAANDIGEGKAVGVAPDAQIYVMKVFGYNGGAYADDLLAAVEDALLLDADGINMSLGSPAGFTSESEEIDEIYGRVSETNTILAVAAGNSNNAGEGNLWGSNSNLTSDPDNSVVSSPATYVNATTVA